MSHDLFDREGMELNPDRKSESSAYHPRIGAPTQILKIGYNAFTHHFENAYGYQNVQKKFSFISAHAITSTPSSAHAKMKKRKNKVLAPF